MKHRVAGRKLGRTSAHRLAVLRNLSTALFERERITTTLAKAKELRPFAEKLVTLSKRETLHARRRVLRHIHDRRVVAKLFDTISARFAQRPGGYTRILKLGPRRGDNAEMAIVELVGFEPSFVKKKPAAEKGKGKPQKEAPPAPGAAAEVPAPKGPKEKKTAAPKKTTKEDKPKKKGAAMKERVVKALTRKSTQGEASPKSATPKGKKAPKGK